MNLDFYMPVRVLMGSGCVAANADVFLKHGKSALIVTDGIAATVNGSLTDVKNALEMTGISYVVFDKVESNPTVECVREGAAIIAEKKLDMVVAIGGGSTMDAGKAMSLMCMQPNLSDQQLLDGDYEKHSIPLITVPTTSGTGSEVTSFAILTSNALNKKINLNSPVLYSRVTMLDPSYALTAPRRVTVNTSIDAMSHAMEGLMTVTSTPIVELIAKEALSRFGRCLDRLKNDAMDLDAREQMMYGCTLAGIAVGQTRTTAMHGISYPMTFYKHTPHGRAIGLLMPPYLEFTAGKDMSVVAPILDALGMKSLEEFCGVIRGLTGDVGPDKMTEAEISSFAAEAAKARNVKNSKVPPAEADILDILHGI